MTVDGKLQPQLAATAGAQRFGENNSDPECCPPELAKASGLEVPQRIDQAAAVLRKAGHGLDPRRIDIYQLGALLCRLLSGKSILAYMYDPTVKAQILPPARALLDRTLGHTEDRFEDCDGLIAALGEAIRQAESRKGPASTHETPAGGSVVLPAGDTPPEGQEPASAQQAAAGLPFERLGHYRILDRIRYGGMGDVYRGYDESLDRQVAIKVLPAELARDKDFLRRFHAEATAVAKLSHPNVVPVYFSGEDAGYHFFAMQFVEGESLSERLRRRTRLPVEEALQVVEQCLSGLEAAHSHGLIHRDIKPGNILIDRCSGRAVLVDFGLVRQMGRQERMTATGMVMGTVDYIAPEQARGQTVDGRADIYSLGVLFYQLLSGRLPFEAETPTAMVFQHAYEEPFPLEEAAHDAPQPVIAIVGRMMAKNPEERYRDCAEVLADLKRFHEGQPVAAADLVPRLGTVPPVAEPIEEPELPADLAKLADNRHLRRARDWAATMFRRHAPEFVQNLQNTTQQVDGAVAHYERRRNRLAKLHAEARTLADQLAEQIQANVESAAAAMRMVESAGSDEEEQAALAKKRECEEHVEALKKQHDGQRQQLEEIEHQSVQADAKLAQLRSQRDVLNARLRSAEAQQQLEGVRPRSKRPRWVMPAAIGGGLILIVALLLILNRPEPESPPQGTIEQEDKLVGATGWTTLFRSSDPSIWNTDVSEGRDRFAMLVAKAPRNMKYLSMRMANSNDSVIIELTRDKLLSHIQTDGWGWDGTHVWAIQLTPPTTRCSACSGDRRHTANARRPDDAPGSAYRVCDGQTPVYGQGLAR